MASSATASSSPPSPSPRRGDPPGGDRVRMCQMRLKGPGCPPQPAATEVRCHCRQRGHQLACLITRSIGPCVQRLVPPRVRPLANQPSSCSWKSISFAKLRPGLECRSMRSLQPLDASRCLRIADRSACRIEGTHLTHAVIDDRLTAVQSNGAISSRGRCSIIRVRPPGAGESSR